MSLSDDSETHVAGLSNGEIFRQIRCAARAGRSADAALLQSKLTKELQKTIKRLYRNHRALAKAFDDLTPFVGPWARFEVGSLHRILGLKCEEVSKIGNAEILR